MIRPVAQSLPRRSNALLISQSRPQRPNPRRHDQLALGLWQGADQRGLLRAGYDAIGPRLQRAGDTFQRDGVDIARFDQVGVKVGTVIALSFLLVR